MPPELDELPADQRRRVRRAVGRGRRVDDLELAPAAVELARQYQARPWRTVAPVAIAGGLAFLAARILIWTVFAREGAGLGTVVGGLVGAALFSAVYLVVGSRTTRSRARQAETRNAQGDGVT